MEGLHRWGVVSGEAPQVGGMWLVGSIGGGVVSGGAP